MSDRKMHHRFGTLLDEDQMVAIAIHLMEALPMERKLDVVGAVFVTLNDWDELTGLRDAP